MKTNWYEEFNPKVLVEKTTSESEYENSAVELANRYGINLYCLAKDYDYYFPEDKEERWIYKMQLTRGRKSYTFTFGQSIAAGDEIPSYYDVFTALITYDPGDFEDFCANFGYDTDSRRAYERYKAVVKEWKAVDRMFGDVLDELSEIA